MALFFASIGATAGGASLDGAVPLVALVATQLMVHAVVVATGAKALRVPTRLALVASNAAVGGPATAVAMVGWRGWPDLAQTAVCLGSLGYAFGTWIGLWISRVLLEISRVMGTNAPPL
jgi:uncharacterized membrane protein